MMVKSLIDMSRPHMLYTAGLGLIMLVSLAVSNVPTLAFSHYIDFALRRELCAGLFLSGSIAGALAIQRHLNRARTPWRIPQSQVALPYVAFFLLTLTAVIIAR